MDHAERSLWSCNQSIVKSMGRFNVDNQEDWISISDIMTGLMVIFMFVAISFVLEKNKDTISTSELIKLLELEVDSLEKVNLELTNSKETTVRLIADFKNDRDSLAQKIQRDLGKDLQRWNATFDPQTLVIRFNGEATKFSPKSFTLPPRFKQILNEFTPKYLNIILDPAYSKIIEELRIEGHAFDASNTTYDSEFNISQLRSRVVYQHMRATPFFKKLSPSQRSDLQFKTVTVSMGPNRMIDTKGQFVHESRQKVCDECSRRVEFRLVTKTEKLLDSITKKLGDEK